MAFTSATTHRAARGPAFRIAGLRIPLARTLFFGDAALALTAAALVSMFSVSTVLLEKIGYHYDIPGGLPFEKFNPVTLLVIMALGARILAGPRPLTAASRIAAADPLLLMYASAIAAAAAHALLVSHLPVTPLVDTLVLPLLVIWLLRGLDDRIGRLFAYMICAFLALNACIALAEFLTGWRLVRFDVAENATSDPTRTDLVYDPHAAIALEWRATALLGHPLENGVINGAFILALGGPGGRWLPGPIRFALLGLCSLAMIAFGARASLVLAAAGSIFYGVTAAARHLASGRGLDRRLMAAAFFVIPVFIVAAVFLFDSGFFDKLISRFVNDQGSAQSRIVMWDMFIPIPLADLFTGPDPAVIATWQRLLGLEYGIESFWVGLPLAYGLIISVMLFLGLAVFVWRVIAAGGPGASAIMLYFFVIGSTSTSLSSKTISLAIMVVFAHLLLRPPDRSVL